MSGTPAACLGCGLTLPEPFLDLGRTALANGLIRPEAESQPEPRFPLAVAYCATCHLVQLTDRVPPAELFCHYLYFSSYSTSFLEHAREMAGTLTAQLRLDAGSRVLEVASNDGYLLQFFKERGIPVLGIEPAENVAAVARERGVPTLVRFFGPPAVPEILDSYGAVDLIVGNNVLAHVPEVLGFLEAARDCLKPRGTAVFEFPYLLDLLEKLEFDTIYHEHVFYYSLTALSRLAEAAGLEVWDVQPQAVHGGSLRVFLGRVGSRAPSPSVAELLAKEVWAGLTSVDRYDRFGEAVESLKRSLVTRLGEWKAAGHRLAAYGAPAKGNTLLNFCGIGRETIDFTVDRSPHKQGLLLPGSRIPIRAPEELVARMPDYTVILPWNIAPEILEQQAEYRRRGGKFVVPIPAVEVLE